MMVKERIIIGIDPGTQVTGYGIITGKGKQVSMLTYGLIQLGKQSMNPTVKLGKIFVRLSGLIAEYQPTEMALEAPFYGKNVQSMLKLGRAQGVAMAAGLHHQLSIFEYAPRKVKMAITGRGAASKEQVAKMLEQHLNFSCEEKWLDATDGLAVALCHYFQNSSLVSSSNYSSWSSFLKDNPTRIHKKSKK